MFVHGPVQFGAVLAPLVARLDDARAIAFDRPGYGLSDAFVYTEENFRGTRTDVVDAVLDGSGIERADLIGHSTGGHASVRFVLAYPDRVRRIALLGAIPAVPGTAHRFSSG